MQAYTLDSGYRVKHHGPKVVPPGGFGGTPHSFPMTKTAPDVTLIEADRWLVAHGFLSGTATLEPPASGEKMVKIP